MKPLPYPIILDGTICHSKPFLSRSMSGMIVKAGFVVNPIAGMGGSVGLKGTDGASTLAEALARGGRKIAPGRAVQALESVRKMDLPLEYLTCSGEMGQAELESAGIKHRVVCTAASQSSGADTKRAVQAFLDEGAELIIFAGGDGTARDVLEAADAKATIIGIPAGVKMHSAVFALTPEALGDLVEAFVSSGRTRDAEVMDVDEESYRQGRLEVKLFGYAKVPDSPADLQASKTVYSSGSAREEAEEIGQYIAETMRNGVAYVLGPGTTTEAIAKHLGLQKTVLGVDVILDWKLALRDASEAQLLSFLEHHPEAEIVVTPIGSQGFYFGRGNQQISAEVIRKIGPEKTCVVATPTKLKDTRVLRVDTGDKALDERLRGSVKVTTGYKRRKLVDVK